MNFGIAGISPQYKSRVKIASEVGYKFVEIGLAGIYLCDEPEIKEFGGFLNELNMPCLSTNGMFPGDIKLIGPEADRSKIEDYLYSAFDKIIPLQAKICVFGSGNARRIPENYSADQAYDEFAALISDTIAPIIEKYGKVLAIEPLNYSECNIVNTVAESMRVVKAVNKPSVKTLIDFYHVRYNGENIEDFTEYKGYIEHVHIASYNNNRRYPRPYDGEDYGKFFDILRKAEYQNQNISIEASLADEGDICFKNSAMSAYSMLKNL